jgi:hypothetical protein
MLSAHTTPATRHRTTPNKTKGATGLTSSSVAPTPPVRTSALDLAGGAPEISHQPQALPARKRGPRPGTAQAKNGGFAVRDRYGTDFYRRIGRKGGAVVRDRRGPNYFAAIGRLGGQTTLQRLGPGHFGRIGRMSVDRTRSMR